MIPPLIPLPLESPNSATFKSSQPPQFQTRTHNAHDSKEDLFSTLFSPSTPRASPTFSPVALPSSDTEYLPHKHTRNVSTDSEFGAFVSVPSNEDPLASVEASGSSSTMHGLSLSAPEISFSPLQKSDFFDEAKAANERNKKGILDELLELEDDPLYFLSGSKQASNNASEGRQGASSNVSLLDLDPDELIPEPPPPPRPPSESLPNRESSSSSENTSFDTIDEDYASSNNSDISSRIPRRPSRHENQSEQPSSSPPYNLHIRSPSLPPSPTKSKPSNPELQRTQSHSTFVPLSTSASSVFSTKWMNSLLSKRPSLSRSPSTSDDYLRSGSVTPPRDHLFRAQTLPAPTTGPDVTHGTPFASHPYTPPSGAPGFAGDRAWNTGKFEFDKERVEKRSVRLLGRKEITTPVLTVEVADMIRPYFPALMRLSRAWTLIYSLDQHGISLKTLYSRCDNCKGSALIVMKDSNDAIFGAWIGEGVHPSKGVYYGGGESFLWKLTEDDTLKVYRWTGKNDYVALCEPEYISFGGGDGHYGLYLDESLSDGSSAPCPTFNNDPLCSAGPRQGGGFTFECVGLEVWDIST